MLPELPIQWIANLDKPSWDCYFMTMTFLTAMRSPDQQTKQGAVIVDWDSRTPIGFGYNGHPRNTLGKLPTMRAGSVLCDEVTVDGQTFRIGDTIPTGPVRDRAMALFPDRIQGPEDKYLYMCHCETNALLSIQRPSANAVLYVPMPSCEACGGLVLNHPTVKIKRIVYFEERNFRNLIWRTRPDVVHEHYNSGLTGDPTELLDRAATYIRLRLTESAKLSEHSTKTYKGAA